MVSSQNTAPVRLQNVQALRGFAALLVLFSHLLVIDGKYSGDPVLPNVLGLGLVGVDLFFVISGFIMVYITAGWREGSARKIPEFLFSRIARIYPIYWLVTAALLAVYLLRPDMVFAATQKTPNILKSFLLIPYDAHPLLEVGWTLIHEMGFYLVFALVLLLPARWRIGGLAVWTGLIVLGRLLDLEQINAATQILFHPLSFEFIAGALAGHFFLSRELLTPFWLVLIGIVAILATVLVIDSMSLVFFHNWLRVAFYTGPACLIILGLSSMEKNGTVLPGWSVKLGDWSYSLYLTHILTVSLIGRIWAKFAQPGPLDNIVMSFVMIAAAIAVAALTYYLAERPMIRAAKSMRKKLFASKQK